ncbi:ubiquitin carboxyl-terminal hydrolase 36-like [Apostichopus japonicus]|uniref:ubiquitin carboxyl-terminal hydrolase 36-like n=1 Tax=Stichopus japonicus TaxID=307972 RepID=UPI003AB79033
MPFSKKYKFSEEEVLRCIAKVRQTKWQQTLSANSFRRHDSLWYQVAVLLLKTNAHKKKTLSHLSFYLYKEYMRDCMLKKWYKVDKEEISTKEDVSIKGTERCDESAATNRICNDSQSEEETNDDTHDLTPSEERFCICCEVNDGSPYLQCDICDNWYHFRCVGLSTSPDTTDHVERSNFTCNRCLPLTGRGICNIGNSCRFAAIIQAIKVTDAGQILKNTSPTIGTVADEIRRFLFELEEDKTEPLSDVIVRQAIKTIAEEVRGPFTNITSQQDASEFFARCISDAIQRENVKSNTPLVTTTFLSEIISCLNCGNSERRQQSLPMLTITTDNTEAERNISAIFQDEVREEVLCNQCKQNQVKGYSYEIHKLPPCLVLNVNRTRAGGRKSTVPVTSLISLEISDFQLNFSDECYAGYHYKLVSAVVHQGVDCRSGHYYTYTFRNNGVVCHNDEDVERCTFEEAVADIAVNGVILFYELSPESSAITWFTEKDDEEIPKLEEENVPLSEGKTADNGTTEKPQVKIPDNAEELEKTVDQDDESVEGPISLETLSSLNVCQGSGNQTHSVP